MRDPTHKPRWYRLTPDRLIIGLVIVECLLWLSERFQWFAFNAHKGWTVLIAVAVVGVFLLLMLMWLIIALTFRLRFQFSIRSLLILTVAVALPCSCLAAEMRAAKRAARREREAVAEIEKLGGHVFWSDPSDPSGPAWLRPMLGSDSFEQDQYVVYVYLGGTKTTDADLENLKGMTRLQLLYINGTEVTDCGLGHLKGLDQLKYLNVSNTQVTDAGVKRLQQALPATCSVYR